MPLSKQQHKQFKRDGFIHVPQVFAADDFSTVKAALTAAISQRSQELYNEGLINNEHKDAPFSQRFGLLQAQSDEIQGGFDIDRLLLDELFDLLRHPKILDCIESLIGPNISINPIHHLRAKPPVSQKDAGFYSVPWHQDAGVMTEDTDEHLTITAWYPLGPATQEMGCMSLIPGVPAGTLLPHISSEYGTAIHPDFMPQNEAVLGACEEGDVIFMSQWCPHHSTPNHSDICRWSMDTRYHVSGKPSGRAWYPSTPVRSNDGSPIVNDPQQWRQAWSDAHDSESPGIVHRISDPSTLVI